MSNNDLAVFYRARQSIRRKDESAVTDWAHGYKIIQRSDYERQIARGFSKMEAVSEYLFNKLDDELDDYEMEITNIQEVTW